MEVPVGERGDSGSREEFDCGLVRIDTIVEEPCAGHPGFPKFEDFELRFREHPVEKHFKWHCSAILKASWPFEFWLPAGYGSTAQEAEGQVRAAYQSKVQRAFTISPHLLT